jgi:hypothetical protein
VGFACLATLYERAGLDLALASQTQLARVAVEKQRRARDEGGEILGRIDWKGPEGARALTRLADEFPGRSWVLLFLPHGEEALFRLVDSLDKQRWQRVRELTALVVAPASRDRALAMVEELPRKLQVDLMHEIFHAQDHLRPWASNYALDADVSTARAYRVFRGVALGLWEGVMPAGEVLSNLAAGVQREGLDHQWEEILVDYYVHNALNLHRRRRDQATFTGEITRWLSEHGYPTRLEARLRGD